MQIRVREIGERIVDRAHIFTEQVGRVGGESVDRVVLVVGHRPVQHSVEPKVSIAVAIGVFFRQSERQRDPSLAAAVRFGRVARIHRLQLDVVLQGKVDAFAGVVVVIEVQTEVAQLRIVVDGVGARLFACAGIRRREPSARAGVGQRPEQLAAARDVFAVQRGDAFVVVDHDVPTESLLVGVEQVLAVRFSRRTDLVLDVVPRLDPVARFESVQGVIESAVKVPGVDQRELDIDLAVGGKALFRPLAVRLVDVPDRHLVVVATGQIFRERERQGDAGVVHDVFEDQNDGRGVLQVVIVGVRNRNVLAGVDRVVRLDAVFFVRIVLIFVPIVLVVVPGIVSHRAQRRLVFGIGRVAPLIEGFDRQMVLRSNVHQALEITVLGHFHGVFAL